MKSTLYKFQFTIGDNSGKRQCFIISAKNKDEAIHKAFIKAKKNAKGDLSYHWECKLLPTF